jgi:hypothetical protein
MNMITGKQLRRELLQPLSPSPALTLRATAMSARVVPNPGDLSAFTSLNMPAQRRRLTVANPLSGPLPIGPNPVRILITSVMGLYNRL